MTPVRYQAWALRFREAPDPAHSPALTWSPLRAGGREATSALPTHKEDSNVTADHLPVNAAGMAVGADRGSATGRDLGKRRTYVVDSLIDDSLEVVECYRSLNWPEPIPPSVT